MIGGGRSVCLVELCRCQHSDYRKYGHSEPSPLTRVVLDLANTLPVAVRGHTLDFWIVQ